MPNTGSHSSNSCAAACACHSLWQDQVVHGRATLVLSIFFLQLSVLCFYLDTVSVFCSCGGKPIKLGCAACQCQNNGLHQKPAQRLLFVAARLQSVQLCVINWQQCCIHAMPVCESLAGRVANMELSFLACGERCGSRAAYSSDHCCYDMSVLHGVAASQAAQDAVLSDQRCFDHISRQHTCIRQCWLEC